MGSSTLVEEAACAVVSGPLPYNVECTVTAEATNLIGATPQRGQCAEFLVTAGSRTLTGTCAATFEVTMRLHRVRVERQSPQAYACNGTSLDQLTDDPEPQPLKGAFVYRSGDGLVRSVPVDVTVVNNSVSFHGSVARLGTQNLTDEVRGGFPIRCRTSTGGGFAGTYKYVL